MRGLFPILCALLLLAGAGGGIAAATAGTGRTPRVNYMLNCQGCHLPDGSGMAGKVPDMRGHLGKFLQVDGGRDYIVRVPGTANSKLDDADVAALLNWLVVEMNPEMAGHFQPYTAPEVARLRADRFQQVAAVRAALIDKIQQREDAANASPAQK